MGIGSEIGDLIAQANPVSRVLDVAADLIDRLVPDKNAAEKAKAELAAAAQAAQQKEDQDNRDINKVEAASTNWFIAGARPALLWICDLAIFCYYIPYIVAATVLWVWLVIKTGELQPRPDLGIADIIGLVSTLLGSAALRTFDKVKGVDTSAIQWIKPKAK